MARSIKTYYDKIASEYDHSRFSNSYGLYIHRQEERVLKKYLDTEVIDNNLDIACGTGRFLKYAKYGVDISEEMIDVAGSKFPESKLYAGEAESLPFKNGQFNNVLCFHLMMHLDINHLKEILLEVHRVTKEGGYFIFDIPSEKRRRLTRYKSNSWRGSNKITKRHLKNLTSGSWDLINYHGVSFFPIHRIPKFIRESVIGLDNYFCESFCKEYSSHLIFILRKIC